MHILSEHRERIYVAGRSKGKQSSSTTKELEIQTMTGEAKMQRKTMLQTEIYVKRKQSERKLVGDRERKRKKHWKRGGRGDNTSDRTKNTTHTSTLSNAEVECGTGLRRNVEVHCAVVSSLISINCSQHLHHLGGTDRGIGEQ